MAYLPEERMLTTPNVREDESSDVGERGDLGLLVLGIIGPDERDHELHHVQVLAVLIVSSYRKVEVDLEPLLDGFSQNVLVESWQKFGLLTYLVLSGSEPRARRFLK